MRFRRPVYNEHFNFSILMVVSTIFAIAGFCLLIVGAEFMIRGAVAVAREANVSPHIIGLTVIAFGTSAPELFVSLKAILLGSPGIAIGNIVGSNIANILLMIGIIGVISPLVCGGRSLKRDCIVLIIATMVVAGLALAGSVDFPLGGMMLLGLMGYLTFCYYDERRASPEGGLHAQEAGEIEFLPGSKFRAWFCMLFGLAALILGAQVLVASSMEIASQLGVSETVVGISMVAVGTSLPELATTIVAVIRRHNEVALGNILGSNIFNSLGVLGAVAVTERLVFPQKIVFGDIWVMAIITLIFVAIALVKGVITRPVAGGFLLFYCLYITTQFIVWP